MSLYFPPWNWDPIILLGLAIATLGYFYGFYELRRRGQLSGLVRRGLIEKRHPLYFAGGLLTLCIALITPLDGLAGILFSVHMVQHVVLIMIAPPLLLLGIPAPLMRLLLLDLKIRDLLERLTNPVVAYILYNANLLLWHVPIAYEAALRNEIIHDVEHALFFYTAILFWWRVIDPTDGWLPLSNWTPAKWIYLLLAAPPSYFLGSVLWTSNSILYPSYAALSRLWGISALQDQQYGGLIMWFQGWMFSMISIGLFFMWYQPKAQPE